MKAKSTLVLGLIFATSGFAQSIFDSPKYKLSKTLNIEKLLNEDYSEIADHYDPEQGKYSRKSVHGGKNVFNRVKYGTKIKAGKYARYKTGDYSVSVDHEKKNEIKVVSETTKDEEGKYFSQSTSYYGDKIVAHTRCRPSGELESFLNGSTKPGKTYCMTATKNFCNKISAFTRGDLEGLKKKHVQCSSYQQQLGELFKDSEYEKQEAFGIGKIATHHLNPVKSYLNGLSSLNRTSSIADPKNTKVHVHNAQFYKLIELCAETSSDMVELEKDGETPKIGFFKRIFKGRKKKEVEER